MGGKKKKAGGASKKKGLAADSGKSADSKPADFKYAF